MAQIDAMHEMTQKLVYAAEKIGVYDDIGKPDRFAGIPREIPRSDLPAKIEMPQRFRGGIYGLSGKAESLGIYDLRAEMQATLSEQEQLAERIHQRLMTTVTSLPTTERIRITQGKSLFIDKDDKDTADVKQILESFQTLNNDDDVGKQLGPYFSKEKYIRQDSIAAVFALTYTDILGEIKKLARWSGSLSSGTAGDIVDFATSSMDDLDSIESNINTSNALRETNKHFIDFLESQGKDAENMLAHWRKLAKLSDDLAKDMQSRHDRLISETRDYIAMHDRPVHDAARVKTVIAAIKRCANIHLTDLDEKEHHMRRAALALRTDMTALLRNDFKIKVTATEKALDFFSGDKGGHILENPYTEFAQYFRKNVVFTCALDLSGCVALINRVYNENNQLDTQGDLRLTGIEGLKVGAITVGGNLYVDSTADLRGLDRSKIGGNVIVENPPIAGFMPRLKQAIVSAVRMFVPKREDQMAQLAIPSPDRLARAQQLMAGATVDEKRQLESILTLGLPDLRDPVVEERARTQLLADVRAQHAAEKVAVAERELLAQQRSLGDALRRIEEDAQAARRELLGNAPALHALVKKEGEFNG